MFPTDISESTFGVELRITVKVVSKKWHEIDTLLLHTTNRKYYMAYPCHFQ